MPRKPKLVHSQPPSDFTDALKFCSLICKDQGTINETHVSIKDNWITAFNGTLAIGHKVDNDIIACPEVKLTLEALSKCGQNIAITQLDNKLSIKSDRFKAVIPCIAPNLFQIPTPDKPIADIDNRLKDAFEICGLMKIDKVETIYSLSILINGRSMISSQSGQMIIEYWHGIDLPNGLAIPKELCGTINKIDKKLTKFGFSNHSVTFYFEDESWMRSQLYAEKWPDISRVFEGLTCEHQFPADFWTALKAVAPFGEGLIYLRNGTLHSHPQDGAGAEFELLGVEGAWCYPARQLAALQGWATHVNFQAGGKLYAVGKNARAVIAGVRI